MNNKKSMMTLTKIAEITQTCNSIEEILKVFNILGYKDETVTADSNEQQFNLTKDGEKKIIVINNSYFNYLNIFFENETEILIKEGTYNKGTFYR